MTSSSRDHQATGLDEVLITDQLARRPAREPDPRKEAEALAALAQELAERPHNLLQKLTDALVNLEIADSAGISLEENGDTRQFRWVALSGQWEALKGGTMPFDASPCGVVIGRDAMLLFAHPERCFPNLAVDPPIHEGLLVPFHAGGRPVGTVWILAHSQARTFDQEDVRLLKSLSRFASAGYQLTQALDDTRIARDELERRVEDRTRALRESEERFRQFGENASDVLWIRNAETLAFEYLSPAFETLYGIGREAMCGDNSLDQWAELVHSDDRKQALDALKRVCAGERVTHSFRIVRPGSDELRWIEDNDFPLFDENGRVRRLGGIAADITARRQAEEHQRLLLAELQHRVRNTLAVIRSISRRTAATSASVEDFAMHLDGRLDAFARLQSAVTRSPGTGLDLEMLVAETLMAVGAREEERVESITGPQLRLQPKAAETLALALHELATNAVKYGALATEQGRIRVEWRFERAENGNRLVIRWIESGVALSGREPRRRGFGTELIERTLAYELDGEASLTFGPDGILCTISLPATGEIVLEGLGEMAAPDGRHPL